MITAETYNIDWITGLRDKLGRRTDPKLLEKVIYALTLLEQLRMLDLTLIFKGGTSLLLSTASPSRFSIDIDVITEHTEEEIASALQKIVDKGVFLKWESDNDRKHVILAPVSHFKTYYKSVVDGQEEPILLDVLYTQNPYPETREIKLAHPWLVSEGEIFTVKMPTYESILGDKLTAFAPETTGILYSKERPVEIVKQLYDIAFLFDRTENIDIVRKSYLKVVKEEIIFRKLDISWTDVLEDTQNACLVLSFRQRVPAFDHLHTGIRNIANFIIDRFTIDEAIIAGAKAAYLCELIKREGSSPVARFENPLQVKDWMIDDPGFNKLNRLKKSNAEAFFYWFNTVTLKRNL